MFEGEQGSKVVSKNDSWISHQEQAVKTRLILGDNARPDWYVHTRGI